MSLICKVIGHITSSILVIGHTHATYMSREHLGNPAASSGSQRCLAGIDMLHRTSKNGKLMPAHADYITCTVTCTCNSHTASVPSPGHKVITVMTYEHKP